VEERDGRRIVSKIFGSQEKNGGGPFSGICVQSLMITTAAHRKDGTRREERRGGGAKERRYDGCF